MMGWRVMIKPETVVPRVNFQFGKFVNSLSRYGALCVVIALMSGCSGLTQMQDSLSKFDQGVHSISTSQMAFYDGVYKIECEDLFFHAAYDYSTAKHIKKDDYFNLLKHSQCDDKSVVGLKSTQIQIRQNLLKAITLYADQLQALASSGADDNKNLDTALQTAATNLNQLAKTSGLSQQDASIAQGVEAAIVGLTNMVIDKRRETDIKKASQNAQHDLGIVIDALKTENSFLATGVDSNIGDINDSLGTVLSEIRYKQGPAVYPDIMSARSYLQTLSLFGSNGPESAVNQLNTALDSVKATNKAIATTGTGGIVAIVNDLVARAKAAEAFQSALSK
jgi:hypothetical protein